jgi:hypothetical protein
MTALLRDELPPHAFDGSGPFATACAECGLPMSEDLHRRPHEAKGVRHVRTADGARRFGQAIGSVIAPDVVPVTPAELRARAALVEPDVTADVEGSTLYAGGQLVMLDKRLKEEPAGPAQVGRTQAAARGVPDVLRYTAVFDDEAYTGGAIRLMKALNALGYRAHLGGWGNAWSGTAYKGLNLRLVPPDSDQVFELQVHTPTSLGAKRETHQLYEAARLLPNFSQVRQELERRMREVSSRVAVPPGATGLSWRGERA